MNYVTSKGAALLLDKEIGSGGEGTVYAILNQPHLAAKIYKNPEIDKIEKLKQMISITNEELLRYTTWPLELIKEKNSGKVVGFLMHKLQGKKELHNLYNPASRNKDFPKANWKFLLTVSRNIAVAFHNVHKYGHVIGDVNQKNILVGEDGKVILIDCDSFQITTLNKKYLCKVGVPEFTSPELQGKNLSHIDRTPTHDSFGLSVLIFHLLFGGRHPFIGKPINDKVGESTQEDIKNFRFAYGNNSKLKGFLPPPKSVSPSITTPNIMKMFEISFSEGGVYNRPSALKWVEQLDELLKNVRVCSSSTSHVYNKNLSECPWCKLESVGLIFFKRAYELILYENKFDILNGWENVKKINIEEKNYKISNNIGDLSRYKPAPLSPKAKDNVANYIAIAIATLVIIGLNVNLEFIDIFFSLIGAYSFRNYKKNEQKKELRERQSFFKKVEKEVQEIENKLFKDYEVENFLRAKVELEKLYNEYIILERNEVIKVKSIQFENKEKQRKIFLDNFLISEGKIKGIGASKSIILQSYGIETAYDISYQEIMTIKGFGPKITQSLVDWQKECEKTFMPQHQNNEINAEIIKLKNNTIIKKMEIEKCFLENFNKLEEAYREYNIKSSENEKIVKRITYRYITAKVNLSL